MWGLKPAALYLFAPPLLMCGGMALFGGRGADRVIADSGNFYYAAGVLATVWILSRRSRKRGSSLRQDSVLEFGNLDRKRLGLLAAAGFGLAVFVSAVITVAPFPQSLMESYRSSSAGLREGRDRLLAMATTLVLAPAAEEIVFRGYMLGRFLSWFTQRQAVFLSAAVFALCHVSLLWMIYACFMGLLLAWVSIREDNTVYSIALHIGFNSSIVLTYLIGGEDSLPVILLGGAALILGVTALDLYRREEIK